MKIGSGVTLLVGGARSGKSDLAVRLGEAWNGPVVFAATAEPIDADMAARIDRHRMDRPDGWVTIEHPTFGPEQLVDIPDTALLILDCVTLLVSNLLYAVMPVTDHVRGLVAALSERSGPTIVVSNEVGMGVHPETELGRTYRDQLGTANKLLAERSNTALLIVAGRALPLQTVEW